MSLIRWALRLWFGHQYYPVNGRSERPHGGKVADKMGDQKLIAENAASFGVSNVSRDGDRNFANSACQPIKGDVFKIYDGSVGAGDPRNSAGYAGDALDGNGFVGFVGQDAVPWLWDEQAAKWLPATQTRHATAYAALQRRAS